MSLGLRQCAFTSAMGRLIGYAGTQRLSIKVQEWNRTIDDEIKNIAAGTSHLSDPNQCRHVMKLAADLYILTPTGDPVTDLENYRILGVFWESLGGRWGGRFVNLADFKAKNGRDFDSSKDIGWDPYHFEFAP